MRRRKALFMGLILLNSGIYVIGMVPQVADSMQQRSGCHEDPEGCRVPPVVFSGLLLACAVATSLGIILLDRGFKHEDAKRP